MVDAVAWSEQGEAGIVFISRRHSSMAEHKFCKLGVVGSTPTVGFLGLGRCIVGVGEAL